MLKLTRISGSLDVGRLGKAVERPGIDPRPWSSLAVVTAAAVDEEGVFVDVVLMPSQQQHTARLGAEYTGPGFGFYFPVQKDDEVLVEAPSGDPDHGLVITRRLWSASDPPPDEIGDHPQDVLLLVRKDQTVRVAVLGSGNIVLETRGTGEVRVGSEDADARPVVQEALADFMFALATAISSSGDTGPGSLTALKAALQALPGTPASPVVPPTGWDARSDKVKVVKK